MSLCAPEAMTLLGLINFKKFWMHANYHKFAPLVFKYIMCTKPPVEVINKGKNDKKEKDNIRKEVNTKIKEANASKEAAILATIKKNQSCPLK